MSGVHCCSVAGDGARRLNGSELPTSKQVRFGMPIEGIIIEWRDDHGFVAEAREFPPRQRSLEPAAHH